MLHLVVNISEFTVLFNKVFLMLRSEHVAVIKQKD
jgi:hypothetical protein